MQSQAFSDKSNPIKATPKYKLTDFFSLKSSNKKKKPHNEQNHPQMLTLRPDQSRWSSLAASAEASTRLIGYHHEVATFLVVKHC